MNITKGDTKYLKKRNYFFLVILSKYLTGIISFNICYFFFISVPPRACQLAFLSFNCYSWIFISVVLPNVSIERPLSAHSNDEFLPSNWQYGWSVLCMQRSLRPVLHWWFICRVNRKTKPLDGITAKELGRERSMQSDASGSAFETLID